MEIGERFADHLGACVTREALIEGLTYFTERSLSSSDKKSGASSVTARSVALSSMADSGSRFVPTMAITI